VERIQAPAQGAAGPAVTIHIDPINLLALIMSAVALAISVTTFIFAMRK